MDNCKVFVSHCGEDLKIVKKFVTLLEGMGLSESQIFCSAVPGYWIPGGEDIYDYLRNTFVENNLFVVYLLSHAFYRSPDCLSEMGATWIKNADYYAVLLPNFDYKSIRGPINPRGIWFKLDDMDNRTYRINELKDKLVKMFSLALTSNKWERIRNDFLISIEIPQEKRDDNIDTVGKAETHTISFRKHFTYADRGNEYIVIKSSPNRDNSGHSLKLDFDNSKLNYVPAWAGLCYLFEEPLNVGECSKFKFQIDNAKDIGKLYVEIKPQGKRWHHDTFEFNTSSSLNSIDISDIGIKTRQFIEEICFVIKPECFVNEDNLKGEFDLSNLHFV